MSNRSLFLRSAGYCLSAAFLLAVGMSSNTFAAPPDVPPGLAKKDPPGVPPGQAKKGQLVLQDLSTFYVGGTIEFSDCNSYDCNSPNPRRDPGNISVNAAYVEKATPAQKKYKYPIVFMHGGGHNGQVFMTTPDGREGWFHSFLRRGFEVYVVDGSNRGRAGWDPVQRFKAHAGLIAASEMEETDTYSEHTAWPGFRWGPEHGVLYPNSQFPFEALNQYLPQLNPAYRDAEANDLLAANISALIDKIGPCILLGWSTGSRNIMEAVDSPARAAQVKGLIGIEGFTAASGGDPALVKDIPQLTVLGDNNNPTSSQAWSTLINNLGGDSTTVYLPDVGIFGNGHTMMVEKNNEQIADLLENWLKEHVE
jgi:hypothetical protein